MSVFLQKTLKITNFLTNDEYIWFFFVRIPESVCLRLILSMANIYSLVHPFKEIMSTTQLLRAALTTHNAGTRPCSNMSATWVRLPLRNMLFKKKKTLPLWSNLAGCNLAWGSFKCTREACEDAMKEVKKKILFPTQKPVSFYRKVLICGTN